MGLSDVLREWWQRDAVAQTSALQSIIVTLKRMEHKMASGEAELQAGIARINTQVDLAVAELKRLADALAAHTDVDLTEEIAAVNELADRLDANVPDAAPPAEPVA